MFGLNLGEFGKGFVGGLAKSVDVAVQSDMERINDRIDKLSEYRIEKAIDDQEADEKELDDIVEALGEAEALFDNHPRASEFAAALLNDAGSVSKLRSEVTRLTNAQNEDPRNLANFFEQQESENPIGSTLDYAKAFQRPSLTKADYRIPEGLGEERKSLLSGLGFDVDITSQVQTRIDDALSARGITTDTQTAGMALPTIKFRREDHNLSRMTPAERIKYLTERKIAPGMTEAEVAYYDTKLQKAYLAAEENGDLETRIDAKTQRLRTMDIGAEGREELIAEIRDMTTERDLTAARLEGDLTKEYGIRINKALLAEDFDEVHRLRLELARRNRDIEAEYKEKIAKAINDNKPEEAKRLQRDLNARTGNPETPAQQLERLTTELGQKVADGVLSEDDTAYKAAMTEISRIRGIVNNEKYMFEGINGASLSQAENMIQDFIDEEINRQLKILPDDLKDLVRRVITSREQLTVEDQQLYDTYLNIRPQAEATVLARLEEAYGDMESVNYWREMATAIDMRRNGDILDPEVNNEAAGGEGAGAGAGAGAGEGGENQREVLSQQQIADHMAFFPDTRQGVLSSVRSGLEEGDTIEEIMADLNQIGYTPSNISAINYNKIPDAITALAGLPTLEGSRTKINIVQDMLGMEGYEAEFLTPILVELAAKQKAAAKERSESGRPMSAPEAIDAIRAATTLQEYETAVKAAMEVTGRSENSIKSQVPPPRIVKRKENGQKSGGLMSRS